MQILGSFILAIIAFWLVSCIIFSVGVVWVKLADKFHQLTKGKWQ